MSYNGQLADRLRNALARESAVEEKKMMGGLTFMVSGKMCVGVAKDDLMVRLAPKVYEDVLRRRGCRKMDITGKPMRGFVFVSPEGYKTRRDLEYWVRRALDFNQEAKAISRRKPA